MDDEYIILGTCQHCGQVYRMQAFGQPHQDCPGPLPANGVGGTAEDSTSNPSE